MTTADSKRMGLAWRIVALLLFIGWIPVAMEVSLNYLFQIEDRFPSTILIIPYMKFVSIPFTLLTALLVLYKGVKGTLRVTTNTKS